MAASAPSPTRSWRALWVSVLLTVLGYLAFSLWGGWSEVTSALGRVGALGMGVALGLSTLNYGLRFLRWQTWLRTLGHRIPWGPSLQIYIAGFALTTTPGKAGEALRSVYLKPLGVSYPESLAAFFVERLTDVLSVLLLACLGLSLYPPARPVALGVGLVVGAVLLFLLVPRLLPAVVRQGVWMRRDPSAPMGRVQRLLEHAGTAFTHARSCLRPPVLGLGLLLGVVGWGAEGLALYWILQWLGADVSLHLALFIFAFAMLIGAVSFLPGGLGGAELTLLGLLTLNGVGEADAVAATVLIRLTTLWYSVALGALCVAFLRQTGRAGVGPGQLADKTE